MLYASDLFQTAEIGKVKFDENLDNIPDLIAEILANAVEERQRRQLSYQYQPRHDVLSRIKGKIDILTTERHQLLCKGKVACQFSELTIDTPRNRFVRSALEVICCLVTDKKLSRRCKSLANGMKALGVLGHAPTLKQMSNDCFGRNDTQDKLMVTAAKLAFQLMLPTEIAGNNSVYLPYRAEIWVRRLFERAVGGFYQVVLSPQGWKVLCGKQLEWNITSKTDGIDKILPNMRTDVILEHHATNKRIIIDTKFASILTNGWYREKSLKSAYIYQMYAYIHSQSETNNWLANDTSGLLLHPSTGEMMDESVTIQGHSIRFATVDLSAKPNDIRAQLIALSHSSEKLN